MYQFCADDSAVLFLDCFGLTRLELPKKVKTDRKIRGGWDCVVTLSDSGEQALVFDADWWRTYAYTMPALKPSHTYERFKYKSSHVLPDGRHMLDEETIQTLAGKQTGSLLREPAKTLPPLVFGPQRELGHYTDRAYPARACAHGAVADIRAPDWEWELSWGRCSSSEGQIAWRRPLQSHGGHRHGLYTHANGLILTSVAPRARQVHILQVDAAGKPEQTLESTGVTVPVWAYGRLAWQVDEDTIVVTDAEGKQTRYSISQATKRAHSVKKHPRALPKGDFLGDLTNTGYGTILIGKAAVLYVPWHGETILDLVNGTEVHRKLPEAEYTPRRIFRDIVVRASAFARGADMHLHGGYCRVNKKDKGFSTGWSLTRGEGGIVGLLVGAAVGEHFEVRGEEWRWEGGSGGASDNLSGTFGEDDLVRAFKLFDDHGVHLYWGMDGIRKVYERRLSGDSSYYGEVLGPLLTREAEQLLLHAFLDSSADAPEFYDQPHRPTPSFRLLDRLEKWRTAKLTREEFLTRAANVRHTDFEESFAEDLARSFFDREIKKPS